MQERRLSGPGRRSDKPGVPPPGLVQDLTGNDEPEAVATSDETNLIAEALDNLATSMRDLAPELHLIAQEIRRSAESEPIPLRHREALGNALRGSAIQTEVVADIAHPEGRRRTASGGGE